MFSLAGIPPLAGFWGKLTLFFSAIQAAAGSPESRVSLWFAVLAIAGALNAAIAAAYYLRVVAVMYFRPTAGALPSQGGAGAAVATFVCAVLLIGVGIFPRAPLQAARKSERLAHPSLAANPIGSATELATRDATAQPQIGSSR
jgi:NADH-quinone oxidoreductase subunit N